MYIFIVVIYNIDVLCRKNRWNFVVRIKFCYIFDNLRYFSVLDIIIYRYYYYNDVWNDLRYFIV